MTLNGINLIANTEPRMVWQPSPWTAVDHPVTDAPELVVSKMNQVLKPYFLLACVAFVVGFASYLAVGSLMTAPANIQDDWQASISAPAPAPSIDAPLAKGKLI